MSARPIPGMCSSSHSRLPFATQNDLHTIDEVEEVPLISRRSSEKDINLNFIRDRPIQKHMKHGDVISVESCSSLESNSSSQVLPGKFAFMDNYLEVPAKLKFIRTSASRVSLYKTTIHLRNKSSRWPVTYRVVGIPSLDSAGFQFPMAEKSIGYLEPQETKEISLVKEIPPGRDGRFSELSSKRLAVVALPIYYRSQLHQRKLQMYWDIIGQDNFPPESCELHEIKVIFPQSEHYCGDCIADKTVTGNFITGQDRLPIRMWVPKSHQYTEGELKTILKTLAPTESKYTIEAIHRDQYREIKECSAGLKKQFDEAMNEIRMLIMACFCLGIAWAFYILYEKITPFLEVPPPPPKPWFNFW